MCLPTSPSWPEVPIPFQMYVNIAQGSVSIHFGYYCYSIIIALIIIIILSSFWATSEETFGNKVGLEKP